MHANEIPKPKSWVRFRPGLCRDCRKTCCQGWPVQVSIPDLIRLELLTEEEAASGQRGKAREFLAPAPEGSLVFVLKQKPNGECIFLDPAKGCTVYEKRPEICRRFPKMGPRPGYCPYLKV